MSRARTLAGAIGSDGALNVADVAGLAAVASSGSASDLSTGTLPIARVADGALTAAKLHATAVTDKLGFTPVNKAGDTMSGALNMAGNAVSLAANKAFADSVWAGGNGYPGYAFAGGNSRFGFSSSTGVIDVYTDGDFYANEGTSKVLHAANYGSYAVPLGGGTMTGRLNVQFGGFGGLVLNKGQGNERVAPEMYSLPIYTYYNGSGYLNKQAKIGTLINNGNSSLLHGRIVRHGDLNYSAQVIIIDFFIHSWGGETNNFCFFGTESSAMGYTGNFATDSSGNVYYHDGMLWEQQTYLYIYDMYNFTFAPADQNYDSSLPWRGVTSNSSYQYEVTRGT